ncbi:metallopeptidase family protein [Aliiruegeria lutimaris]|uniref:Predicted Zn-dependent protease, minimal metalloprotease (MMP)-like domain n=1 Tax=Aliiruegeria lutimaris TaxID=571298 RepID=A0A1G8JNY5_9RHOB|nr:metallopeptidase family protein [Aliiruegeria lutimaris]SDI32872.1 Predicted Zn-dependent protease, minimal metalloprotease (MMP)-like domain [Aliiruegeria lutimaris]
MDLPDSTSNWNGLTAPNLDDLAQLAEEVRAAFPPPFADPARQVLLRVEELASDEMLADLGLEDPLELTGLYDGTPMTERSVIDPPQGPDIVWLFRRAILDEWVARGDFALGDLVANVVTHEFAHHFGWSDADIARIDRWWE